MDVALEVLKWVAIVFAAGVVGQFGKSLTLRLLGARRGRAEKPAIAAASETGGEPAATKQELKLRKKRLKAEAKLRKKGAASDSR